MKTLLQTLVLCLIAAFVSGCEETVTSSKLQGTWKVTDSTNAHIIGDVRVFLEDGRCIAYDRIGFTRYVSKYSLNGSELNFLDQKGNITETVTITLKKGILIWNDPEDGFTVKMKRIED